MLREPVGKQAFIRHRAPAGTILTVADDGRALVSDMKNTDKGMHLSNADSIDVAGIPVPEGGGILYVDNGVLKFRGSSGTVTTLADA